MDEAEELRQRYWSHRQSRPDDPVRSQLLSLPILILIHSHGMRSSFRLSYSLLIRDIWTYVLLKPS